MEQVKSKKTLLSGGVIISMIAALIASLIFFNDSTQAAPPSGPGNPFQAATPLNADQDGEESSESAPKSDSKDFDLDSFSQAVDNFVNSILSDINERYSDVMPEDGGSFFSSGDTIARQVDGVWEFSTDGGETWTNEAPEGFEASEDGTRFRMGGGEGDIDDFDVDSWLEEQYNEWRSYFDKDDSDTTGTTGTAQNITI